MMWDCLIVGGGPAGLTAATYLGRFLRRVIVIDNRESRARWIPTSHNYPGFPEGVHGEDFLENLCKQAIQYGAFLLRDKVASLKKEDSFFTASCGQGQIMARKIILATGIVDEAPAIPGLDNFVYSGVVRFCPICDGYEARDKRVGIIGPCDRIYKKACFLRTYTGNIEIFPIDENFHCDKGDRDRLLSLGLTLPDERIAGLSLKENHAEAVMESGRKVIVDVLYPAMGAKTRSDLATAIGARHNDNDCIYTDSHQQTNIEGLYAIGDITLDLSQISVGTGQAAIAATAIHNALPANPR
jgi:thioredoxin reductase (NADPH)